MAGKTKTGPGRVSMLEEKRVPKPRVQNVILENRQKLSITGVVDVESFNDECVVADTELGILVIKGMDLRINKLDIDSSELGIEGDIVSLEYSDREGARGRGGGFFARLFR
jgi:sporulation protein YabP